MTIEELILHCGPAQDRPRIIVYTREVGGETRCWKIVPSVKADKFVAYHRSALNTLTPRTIFDINDVLRIDEAEPEGDNEKA